jgi:hypothetical protein
VANIVVVEDEAELAAAIAARLRSDGHCVTVAIAGTAWLAVAAAALLLARRVRGLASRLIIGAGPVLGLILTLRSSPWVIVPVTLAIALLLLLGVSLGADAGGLSTTFPAASARLAIALGHLAAAPGIFRSWFDLRAVVQHLALASLGAWAVVGLARAASAWPASRPRRGSASCSSCWGRPSRGADCRAGISRRPSSPPGWPSSPSGAQPTRPRSWRGQICTGAPAGGPSTSARPPASGRTPCRRSWPVSETCARPRAAELRHSVCARSPGRDAGPAVNLSRFGANEARARWCSSPFAAGAGGLAARSRDDRVSGSAVFAH